MFDLQRKRTQKPSPPLFRVDKEYTTGPEFYTVTGTLEYVRHLLREGESVVKITRMRQS